jgi:hypothetical protein
LAVVFNSRHPCTTNTKKHAKKITKNKVAQIVVCIQIKNCCHIAFVETSQIISKLSVL